MSKGKRAFTLVEVLIIVAVIGILATIGFFSFSAIQKQVRDSERSAKATALAEELEKYYENNGEYPGCEALTADASVVRQNTLKTIEEDVLHLPKASDATTNSVLCDAIESHPDSDIFSYTGDTSAACTTGPACASWELKYRTESGEIVTLKSRYKAETIATTPTITATAAGMSQINTNWNAVVDATSYELQRSPTSGFSTITTTTHSTINATVTGLTPETTYYFRVRAILPSSTSGWSNVASATTTSVTIPSGVAVIVATMSGTNARGTTTGGSCATGSTIERQIRFKTNDGSWSGWVTGTPRDVAATEGYKYTFQPQTRCVFGSINSAWVVSPNTASVIRPVTAPSGLTITAIMSGANAQGTSGGGSCASGTTIQRQIRSRINSGTWSNWTIANSKAVPASEGNKYTFQQQARCVGLHASSEWAASSTASVTRAIAIPSGLTISAAMSGTNARGTAGGGSCASGTTLTRQIRYQVNGGTWSGWVTGTPREVAATQGYKYTFQQQARCTGASTSSIWVASGTASVTRAVAAPSGLTISAAMSGTNARGTASGGSCASGTTIQRQIRYHSTNTSTAGTWSGWVTGTPREVAATQGYKYTFQQQARCTGTNASSGWVASGTASVVRPISGPSGLTIVASMSGTNARGTAAGGSCPSGSTITRQIRYYVNGGSWSGWTTGTPRDVAATQGYKYTFQQQARCVGANSTSAWTTSGTASVIRSVAAPSGLTISAAMSGTNARGTAGGGSCASGTTLVRQIRYKADSGSWSAWATGTPRDVAAKEGHSYTFQQQARCDGNSADSIWVASGTASVSRSVAAPSGLTIVASMSGTNARGTAAGGGCTSGSTLTRQIRYQVNGGTWSGWVTGTPREVAATQGYKYTFQQQARCGSNGVYSGWVSSSSASVTRPVTAPSGLTISAAMSGTNARGTAGGGSCASGTTLTRQIRYHSTNTSTAGTWSGWVTGTPRDVAASQGYRYTFQQQARCTGTNANSAWVPSGTASVVRGISTPSAPTVTVTTSGNTTTYTRSSPTCPSGTTIRYQFRTIIDYSGGYDTDWSANTTSTNRQVTTTSQGYEYKVWIRAQCYTVHASSLWSGAGSGVYVRPVSGPGAITYRIARNGTSNEAHVYASSSCHSSVSLYSRADAHTWDYKWLDSGKLGWYADSHNGSWSLNNWGYYGNEVHTGATNGTHGPYASGSRWNIATDMRCRNSVTGRQSATTGRRESGILYLP